jgi:hypothetical protein
MLRRIAVGVKNQMRYQKKSPGLCEFGRFQLDRISAFQNAFHPVRDYSRQAA